MLEFPVLLSSFLFTVLTLNSHLISCKNVEDASSDPKLLLLMIDGFRWDYLDRQIRELNGLRQFISEGVQAEWVNPIFPSLSFPNWLTVSTGLFAENHGIIGNYMLDLGDENRSEAVFSLLNLTSYSDPRWWKNIEPIWITATKNNLTTSLLNFPLCDIKCYDVTPAYCSSYKFTGLSTLQLRENVFKAKQLLEQNVSFAMVYDDVLDNAGHAFGPDSYEVKGTLLKIDAIIQELMLSLKGSTIENQLNIVILSDHGMTNVQKDTAVKYVSIDEHVDMKNIYKVVDFGALATISAAKSPNAVTDLYKQLIRIPGIDVYMKADIPEEFHYKKHELVLDILLVAHPGFYIMGVNEGKQIPDHKIEFRGNHGYYNMSEMRGIFFARGPAFETGLLHYAINIEDEYQLYTNILSIPSMPNNGSWDNVSGLLKTEALKSNSFTY